ncbi:hypothetical protein F5984_24255 [Rudanella paleaurantiibacter]|uniref:Uncharacterized protein n=1 Tax=Rudanella paleaurantiibacter TaxID=2614655 RepID=A0A7J5TSM5_9BACT|nr:MULTISPECIES: hypothetical protein [Rudanella]KAB7726437.1 hypothetical protein F5984_24255 [Rudanella paleaurantiibacter]
MKSYQQETVNKHGETVISDIFRYIEGEPKQYRYNSQTGQFNIDGDTPVLDKSGKPIKEFTFQPFVFRIFEDGLFNRNREAWAELFFIDALNCVSSIMFNGTTLTELRGVMKKLIYEGNEPLNLCDVVLTIRPEKLTSKNDPTKSWFIGRFSYQLADPESVQQLAEYAADCPIYRRDTLKHTANYFSFSETFALPSTDVVPVTLNAGELPQAEVEAVEVV